MSIVVALGAVIGAGTSLDPVAAVSSNQIEVTRAETASVSDASADADPECDRLFGTDVERERNRRRRHRRLLLVEPGPAYVDILQTGGWREPTEITYGRLHVASVETDDEGQPVAVVRLEGGGCQPGEYDVLVDDALGRSGRVLAILPDFVLIEHEDELRYLRVRGSRGQPVFKVSWRSPFSIVADPGPSAGAPKRSSARPRRRKR